MRNWLFFGDKDCEKTKEKEKRRKTQPTLSLAGSFNKEVTRLYSFWGIPETDWIRGVFELVDSVF